MMLDALFGLNPEDRLYLDRDHSILASSNFRGRPLLMISRVQILLRYLREYLKQCFLFIQIRLEATDLHGIHVLHAYNFSKSMVQV